MLGSGTERVSARGSQLRPRNEDITETGTPFLAVALIQRSISKWLPDELPAPRANSVTIIGNLFCADCLCFHLHPHPRSYHDPPFCRSAAIIAAVFLPVATQAQGVPGGVERGARDGERAAGPVGAIVGGVIGGVVGGGTGVLGVDERPRFRSYVVEQRRPSYQYREDLRVGAILPEEFLALRGIKSLCAGLVG